MSELFQPEPGTPFAQSPLSLNWMAVFHHYLPEICEVYARHYVWFRNGQKWGAQQPYELDTRRYPARFWAEVFYEHCRCRFSMIDTLLFLYRISGLCVPWPDMLRRIPSIIHGDFDLTSRFQSRPAGSFPAAQYSDPATARDELFKTIEDSRAVEQGGINGSPALLIYYHMMIPQNRELLIDIPKNRMIVASHLDALLAAHGLESVERGLAPHLTPFFDAVALLPLPYAPRHADEPEDPAQRSNPPGSAL